MHGTIGHVEVLGEDPAPLRDFYSAVFGWQVGPVEEDDPEQLEYSMIRIEDRPDGVSAGIGRRPDAYLPVTFYVRVDDIEVALAGIEARGGRTVTSRKTVGPGVSIARFADPAGNVVGLLQR
jgi:hypothetical protein